MVPLSVGVRGASAMLGGGILILACSFTSVHFLLLAICKHGGKLYISCKIAQCRKTLISIFQQLSANIRKILNLEGRLGTRL